MHSFEVRSNESAYRKSGRLGLEQFCCVVRYDSEPLPSDRWLSICYYTILLARYFSTRVSIPVTLTHTPPLCWLHYPNPPIYGPYPTTAIFNWTPSSAPPKCKNHILSMLKCNRQWCTNVYIHNPHWPHACRI